MRHAIASLVLIAVASFGQSLQWDGYERLTREQVLQIVSHSSAPPDLYAKNLSGLNLAGVDFNGANLSAAVLNDANLIGARLDGCKLNVAFLHR